uniref:Large ribosomal subunit protein mL43 n=1 Tax=Tetraselmis sp. GSL018 TaxID=582737 RepID=A0A061RGS9_9CHLO|mmetsp:Transcript_30152/g.71811  ORF Transcript_30152/g.71811 Transcript_30152/m.71811 type:complete len:129 (-) Transcript_30152:77-463(-)|eukprot:CAMPEP_0177587534 /NCGR_PEP_ID=MMETSP0419_2-20121207/5710_1 /TAXON_ID=582737 /ORGANISM="Tetraselmis sp., Strain GSL018" /LENGTH=128 /DNA_ID=CAMNT_0019077605 /DNA_START=415 /DNA_END=801 /DNA_ORIENTATION=+
MAAKGVWQLTQLRLHYCPFSGSSRGVRAFVEHFLPIFREQNSQLVLETAERRGKHPYLYAEYRNGNTRVIGLKNQDEESVLRHAQMLRSCHGRPASEKVRWRHIQEQRSVQGGWRPGLFEQPHAQPGT